MFPGAAAALVKLRQVLDPARRMDVAYFRFQEAGVLLLQERAREAAVAARRCRGHRAGERAASAADPALPRAPRAVPSAPQRDQRALAVYREAVSLASGPDKRNFGLHETLVHAFDQLRGGNRGGATALLRSLLPTCREMGYFGFNRMAPQVVAPVLALALAEDIERDYVRMLIRRRKLPPPSPDIADWPWPLALRTLGEFVIAHDGVPLVSKGKAQKKPLELLKALIAHGGRNVDAAMLTALLWPDAEGDDAKTSFDSNLYRLRKLLAADGAVLLADGKLSLNPEVVWLDVWAFENALDSGQADAALALYRGHFLALDAASPWVLPARDRLQAKLVRAVLATGEVLEGRGEWDRARGALRTHARGRQPGRGPLPAPDGLPARDRRPGGGAHHLPALPRAAVDRAQPAAVGRDGSHPRHAQVRRTRPGRRHCPGGGARSLRADQPLRSGMGAGAAARAPVGWDSRRRPGPRPTAPNCQSVSDPPARARRRCAPKPSVSGGTTDRSPAARSRRPRRCMRAICSARPIPTTFPAAPAALATPFAWPQSGLEPMPWFPFTVAASRGHAAAAARVAQRTERAYWYLRRLFAFTPRFRLLVLGRDDWARYAEVPTFGVPHLTAGGHLIVGSEPAAAWHGVSRELAALLPATKLRALVKVHGQDRSYPAGPDLAGVADALLAHEVAHLFAAQANLVVPPPLARPRRSRTTRWWRCWAKPTRPRSIAWARSPMPRRRWPMPRPRSRSTKPPRVRSTSCRRCSSSWD